MRWGSQHVRAPLREPLGWRSRHGVQACGVRHAQPVRAAPPHGHARCGCGGQCGRAEREHSHIACGRPCQGAQAQRCRSDACRGELRRTFAADPPPRLCSVFFYCTDGCSVPSCTPLWCWRRPARTRLTRCPFRRTQPLPPARASHAPPSRARHSPPRTRTGRTFAALRRDQCASHRCIAVAWPRSLAPSAQPRAATQPPGFRRQNGMRCPPSHTHAVPAWLHVAACAGRRRL
jgi:hypothetical protein